MVPDHLSSSRLISAIFNLQNRSIDFRSSIEPRPVLNKDGKFGGSALIHYESGIDTSSILQSRFYRGNSLVNETRANNQGYTELNTLESNVIVRGLP